MGYRTVDQTSLGKDRIILALITKLKERQGELGLSGAYLGFSLLFFLSPFIQLCPSACSVLTS